MLSPGVMHDVDLTVELTPTTPRQSISSSPTTPRQRTYYAFEGSPWDIYDPLHGLHMVQVDDEHFFARWRYSFGMQSAWRDLSDPAWLRNVQSERIYGLVPEREAIILCKYVIHVCLCVDSFPTALRGAVPSEDVDLIIYTCHNPHTQTVGVRFIVEGTQAKHLRIRTMGFELVTSGLRQTCKFGQSERWMNKLCFGLYRTLLGRDLVIADESGLQPFTWPSNDDDVQRAQFFTSHFGHGAAANSLV